MTEKDRQVMERIKKSKSHFFDSTDRVGAREADQGVQVKPDPRAAQGPQNQKVLGQKK
jgi:hypothetical protein